MPHFNILDGSTSIYRNMFLEASAGTGKTFAIEHLFVRLLLQDDPITGHPCQLPQILAVTFTRAAARELKMRIRTNIEKALSFLRTILAGEVEPLAKSSNLVSKASFATPSSISDYLLAQTYPEAIVRLEIALTCFDEAQIFTLHGFCAQALRSHLNSLSATYSEESPQVIALNVVRNFFRTGLDPRLISPVQLKRLVGSFRGDMETLQMALAKDIARGPPIQLASTFEEHLQAFRATMNLLKGYEWQPEFIIADFNKQLSAFKKLGAASPASLLPAVERMAHLFAQTDWSVSDFEQLLRDDLVLAKLELSKRQINKPQPELHYPNLRSHLQELLLPVISKALDSKQQYALLAHHCQKLLEKHLAESETGGPDQLLKRMESALQDQGFLQGQQKRYRFAIVDEFQDTDPLQWRILTKLFLDAPEPKPYLALVGDPKQSIYSFRQADLYTYLNAAKQFSSENQLALMVNHRSQKPLVDAINSLFNERNSPGLIALPQQHQALPYPDVQAAIGGPTHDFSDNHGALHFFLLRASKGRLRSWPGEELERHRLLPYVAEEILKLHRQEGLAFKQMAILVRDRHQAASALAVLQEYQIPVLSQRQGSLADSPARQALLEWLLAMSQPLDQGALRCVLGGPLIAWSAEQLVNGAILAVSSSPGSQSSEEYERAFSQIHQLRQLFFTRGFASHIESLFNSHWHPGGPSVLERLLSSPSGIELYRDLQQITYVLGNHQAQTHCGFEGLVALLDQFPQLALQDEESLRIQFDGSQDAVKVLTMHMSKGLEFDIVFALGLVKRSEVDERLVCDSSTQLAQLRVMDDDDSSYQTFCSEQDAEKVRQAYVAMTRAKYRLYVPVAICEEGSKIHVGQAAPIELLLGRLGQPPCDEKELYRRINHFDGSSLLAFASVQMALSVRNVSYKSISYEWLSDEPVQPSQRQVERVIPELTPPKDLTLSITPCRAHSFTSLMEERVTQSASDESQSIAPSEEKNRHTLPAGRETGILIHQILQTIPYHQPVSLAPFLAGTVLEGWEPAVSQMVHHALHTPLPLRNGQTLRLADIDPSKQYREMEFFYPFTHEGPAQKGFLRGSIDLLFSHDHRYYLVDWKTHWLGPNVEAYHSHALVHAIQQQGYQLQADIYAQAMRRYLSVVDPRPFEECYGGTFILFLRGLNADVQPSGGVYATY